MPKQHRSGQVLDMIVCHLEMQMNKHKSTCSISKYTILKSNFGFVNLTAQCVSMVIGKVFPVKLGK